MSSSSALTFVGGAGTVTGSKTIVETSAGRVLVDCGLFQGRKELRRQNWEPLPVPPESIDAVVLTHAHLDHCGYIPRLFTQGFSGPVYCTEGTKELAGIILPDSGHLQEEEARYANRKGYSKHDPALPLYTKADAIDSLRLFETVDYGIPTDILSDLRVTWLRAGHILGSASLRLEFPESGTVAVFSGDLGTFHHPLLAPPDPIGSAQVVVTESTYGDEEHAPDDPEQKIFEAVRYVVETRGVLVVPAFAVDRTEIVLWHLDRLVADGRIPEMPVVVDSPMASRALDVYRRSARDGSPEFRPELRGERLFPSVDPAETTTVDESKALNVMDGPLVIISASGMATGGRVIHHLAQRIGDRDNAVLLVGFQAPGTRGDALRSGANKIKMFGRYHTVKAPIFDVELSAHADQSDLLEWLGTADGLDMVYINHGEPDASRALEAAIESRLGVSAVVPYAGERVVL